MKGLVTQTLLLFFFSASLAGACPNVSGIYALGEQTLMKYQQVGCESLIRTLGLIESDGKQTFSDKSDKFQLDRSPLCHPYNKCESIVSTANTLNFSLNFSGGVRTDNHGDCSQHSYSLSNDENGNLKAVFYSDRCSDGFSGTVIKTFSKN